MTNSATRSSLSLAAVRLARWGLAVVVAQASTLAAVVAADEFQIRPGGFVVLPAGGVVQAQDEFLLPGSEALIESIWLGNVLYRREVPLLGGHPDRSMAGEWRDATPETLPGGGDIRSYDLFRRPDGTAIEEALWRGDEGFGRVVPIVDGTIDWEMAGSWSAPIPVAVMPGEGDIHSGDNHLAPDGGALLQAFWRGERGWGRAVPVIDERIRWDLAGDWFEPMTADRVPGSGTVEAQSGFLLPASFEQVYWRGGEEIRLASPIVDGTIDRSSVVFARALAAMAADLAPLDYGEGDGGFGFALDLEGDLLAVATAAEPGETPTCSGAPYCVAGAAEIYARGPLGGFARVARFAGAQGDFFGYDVAVAGSLVAIGIPGRDVLKGAVEIYGDDGNGFASLGRLPAPAGGFFGASLAFDGHTLAVGAPDAASERGRAYVFRRHHGATNAWGQVAEVAPELGFGDGFGVVALAGDTLAVGSREGGPVAIYRRQRGGTDGWGQTALLEGAADEAFGRALALRGDTLLVAAPGATVDGQAAAGAAYVFRRDADDSWRQSARLVAEQPSAGAAFGSAVTLGDGLAAVGGLGAAYLFGEEPRTGAWRQVQKHAGGPAFGTALALDARTLLAGAYGDWIGEVRGSVHLLEAPPLSPTDGWREIELADAGSDGFGTAVARIGDAVAVSAPGVCTEGATTACPAGRVEIFERGTAGEEAGELGAWRTLNAPTPTRGDGFGTALAATSDLLAVGAPRRGAPAGEKPGAVYLFGRDTGGFRGWGQVAALGLAETSAAGGFGAAVALDGEHLLIGAPDGGAGEVTVHEPSPDADWKKTEVLTASDGLPGDGFGEAVALVGDLAVIGAPGDDMPGLGGTTDVGAVYVFGVADGAWSEVAKLIAKEPTSGARFGAAATWVGDLLAVAAPGDGKAVGKVHLFAPGDQGSFELAAVIRGEDFGVEAGFGATLDAASGLLLVGSRIGPTVLLAPHPAGPSRWLEVGRLPGAEAPSPGDTGTSGASAGVAVDLAAVAGGIAATLGRPSATAGDATVFEPPWQTSRQPRIELLAEHSVVLSAPGDSHQFEPRLLWPRTPDAFHPGGWTATPPAGFDDEYAIAWSSSDPQQATVGEDGTATVRRDDAYAVIQARLKPSEGGTDSAALPDHDPGHGAVMIATLNPALVRLSDGLVTAHEVSVGERMADSEVRLEVRATPATEALVPGQQVLFGDDWGLQVGSVEPSTTGLLTIRGRPLSLEEIFSELHVDFEWPPSGPQARSGGDNSGATAGDSGVDLKCGITFTWQTEVGSLKFEPEVIGGSLVSFAVYGEMLTSFILDPAGVGISQDQELACVLELPDIYLATVRVPSFPALGVKLEFATAFNLKAFLGFEPGFVFETQTPQLDVQQTTGAGFDWNPIEATLQRLEGPEPNPRVDFQPNLTHTEEPPRALEIVLNGTLTVEVGGKWNLTLGPPTDRTSIGEIYGPVLEFGPAREYRLPFAAFLTPDSEAYVGPAITDRLEATIHPIKTLGLNEDSALVRALEYLGVDTDELHLELPGIEVYNLPEAPFPTPTRPEPTEPMIWVDGAANGLPESAGVLSTLSEWNGPSFLEPIDTCGLLAWREGESPATARVLAADGLVGTFTPQPGDEGIWRLRSHCTYHPLASGLGPAAESLPVVSATSALEVMPKIDLAIVPAEIQETVAIGKSRTVALRVVNLSPGSVAYTVTPEPAEAWIEVNPAGGTVAGNSEELLDLTLTCGDDVEQASASLVLTTEGAVAHGAEVELHCSLFKVVPPSRRVVASPGESWQTHFDIVVVEDIDTLHWFGWAPQEVNLDPSFGFHDARVTVSGVCSPPGTSVFEFRVLGSPDDVYPPVVDRQFGTISLSCRDGDGDGDGGGGNGGNSTGEPHLATYDGVSYDFQAPGEFVFSRDAARGFEVQVRQKPIADGTVAVNRAVALGVGAGASRNRVAFYGDPPPTGGPLMVDGVALDLAVGAQHDLAPSGGKLWRRDEGRWLVEWPAANGAWVEVRKISARAVGAFNLYVEAPSGATTEGLLGDFDGDPANDFALRDGTALSSPPTHGELYDCISGERCFAFDPTGGWWIQTTAESLFDYPPGGGPWNFNPPQPWQPFPPRDLGDFDPDLVEWARDQCQAAGIGDHQPALLDGCALDILLTGDVEFGTAAADYADPPVPTTWVARGEITQPPCDNTCQSFGRAVGLGGDKLYISGRDGVLGVLYEFQPGSAPGTWVEGLPVPPVFPSGFGSRFTAQRDRVVSGFPSSGSEAAWVYERTTGGWQITELAGRHNTSFGTSTAVSGDIAAVGERYGATYKGAARVYERDTSGNWQPIQTVVSDDGAQGDQFGTSVALANDFLVVGATHSSPNEVARSGAVYVFQREDDGAGNVSWKQQARVLAASPAEDENFGTRLAFNGTLLAVAQDPEMQTVEIFRRADAAGTIWTREGELGASVPSDSNFGVDIALSGETLFVGAPAEDGDGPNRGAVYLYRPDGAGGWAEVDRWVPDDPADHQQFGHHLAASAERLLVSAWNGEAYGTDGSVFVYDLE